MLSTLESAIETILGIEKKMTLEDGAYLENRNWCLVKDGYDRHRLWYTIFGLQKVIKKNGGNLFFSKLPDLTKVQIP